jgi:hypothetical protein
LTQRRILFAQKTWSFPNWTVLPHWNGARDSRIIGENRELPFIQDVVRKHWNEIPDDGIIVLTNTDSCLVKETEQILTKLFKKREHCWSCRFDFQKTSYLMKYKQIRNGSFYSGKDLFAFRKHWWEEINFPDLILGCMGWDWLLYKLMGDDSFINPIVYHERHSSLWHRDSPGNVYNTELIKKYANQYLIGNIYNLRRKSWNISDYEFYI